MEGLAVLADPARPSLAASQRLAERWLAFLFLLMLGGVALVSLCAEILTARG